MEIVAPLAVQTPVVAEANTTGLVEAPGVAETVNVPPVTNTGSGGDDAKLPIAWSPFAIFAFSAACGAASQLSSPAWLAVNAQFPAASMVTMAPSTLQNAGDVVANTSGALEGPAVAETTKVPPGL